MARLIDMTGKKFNECNVIKRYGSNKDKKATWLCECFCGETFVATGKDIRNGNVKSCGCYRNSILNSQGGKNKTHNETKTRLYNIWRGIKKRCYIPNDTRGNQLSGWKTNK